MNRFLITFIVGAFSTLSAADYDPHSPTQQYQSNINRIEEKIQFIREQRAAILDQLALLDHSDQRDARKPESDKLNAFKVQKQLNRQKYADRLNKLNRDLKKLSKEMKRLESTQAG